MTVLVINAIGSFIGGFFAVLFNRKKRRKEQPEEGRGGDHWLDDEELEPVIVDLDDFDGEQYQERTPPEGVPVVRPPVHWEAQA